MITTRKLAQLAGVSQSTISRCLNDSPEISRETRERVRNIAKQNGYIIKKYRRKTIATANRKAIAVLMTGMAYTNLYHKALVVRLFDRIEAENYFAIHINDKDISDTRRVEELISTGIVEGVIIIKRHFNPLVGQYLSRLGTPHVYLHYFGKESVEALNIINTDNYHGGYIATRHLLDLGHRRIKVLSSFMTSKENHNPFLDRTSGFLVALKENGLEADDDDVAYIEHDYDTTYKYVEEHLNSIKKNYTAVFAHNDTMAIACINALQDHGVAVPDAISVIGYDGIAEGEFCRPAVTTVHQPVEELVSASIKRLTDLMNAPEERAVRTYIQPTMLIRGSTRACGNVKQKGRKKNMTAS